MTGQKNRFKTTEKLWDLDDKSLKTPKHDAMVLWLMDKSHLLEVIPIEERVSETYNDETFTFDIRDFNIKSEVPVMSSKTFIAGYLDLQVDMLYYCEDNRIYTYSGKGRRVYHNIEIKPYVDSFGAVLRQIQSYSKFTSGKYYLFTLDSRFDAQFESQGITVIHPPNGITIDDMIDMYGLR